MLMSAQNTATDSDNETGDKITYALIQGIEKYVVGNGNQISVQIDFGEDDNLWSTDERDKLIGNKNIEIKFNSMLDALNFMVERGWKLENAYGFTSGNKNIYHWLISKKKNVVDNPPREIKNKQEKKKKKRLQKERYIDPLYE